MLHKIFNKVIMTPVLLAGVSFPGLAFSQEQIKPNIHQLTSDKTAQKVNNNIPTKEEADRIPSELNKHSIGLGIGQTFLRSDFHEHGSDKIAIPDLYYNYSASYSFDFTANLHYAKFEFQEKDVTLSGLALAIKGKGFQFDAFSPFVLGGFGFYIPSATRNIAGTPKETRSQLVFGINLGAGGELRLNKEWTIGVIAHYHDPFDVRQDDGSDFEGSYMKLLVTGSYTFN